MGRMYTKTNMITAEFQIGPDQPAAQGVPVINPGDWWGNAFLIAVANGFQADYYIVEADNYGDAIDEFVDSEHGKTIHVQDHEMKDYGHQFERGDEIGGEKIAENCWMTLDGQIVRDSDGNIVQDAGHPLVKYLREPSYGGNGGQAYDDENVQIYGGEHKKCPFQCRYHGDGIPEGGLTPIEYSDFQNCEDGLKAVIMGLSGGLNHTARKSPLRLASDIYEAALELGRSEGWESADNFYQAELGGSPWQLIPAVKEAFDIVQAVQDPSESEEHILSLLWPFLKKSRRLRDPQCRLERTPDGGFIYKYFGGDNPPTIWHCIDTVPRTLCDGRVRFTFERMLEEWISEVRK